jgi:tetratricopeptide (TPR) repeat protein
MRKIFLCFAASLLPMPAISAPPEPGPPVAGTPAKPADEASVLIRDKKPAEAIVVLDRAIAAESARYSGESRQIYCAHTPEESLLYTLTAANDRKAAIVIEPTWCMAIFLKGFALIDLNRPDEARPLFERALAMAPMNSQFLAELGEWHKGHREWDRAYSLFEKALEGAIFSTPDIRNTHKTRALRGMAFVLIEQGKLDQAERRLRECLQINPNDESAKNELQYISEQRGRRRS